MKKLIKKTSARLVLLLQLAILMHLFFFIMLYNNRQEDALTCNMPGVENKYYVISYNYLTNPNKEEAELPQEEQQPDFVSKIENKAALYTDIWTKNKRKGKSNSKSLKSNKNRRGKKGKKKNKNKSGNKAGHNSLKGGGKKKLQGQGKRGRFKYGKKKRWKNLVKDLDKSAKRLADSIPDKFLTPLNEEVSKSYVYRKRRHREIMVKEVFPTLYSINQKFSDLVKGAPKRLTKFNKRNEIIKQYELWESGKPLEDTLKIKIMKTYTGKKTPLSFTLNNRQSYFDRNIKLSKEQQLSNFLQKYGNYHPNKGDLPVAVRELYYKNIQRIAYPFIQGDLTFFILDYYQENLNKEDYLINMLNQVKLKLGTKTMTEILFSLENIYDIQARAIGFYFQYQKRIKPFLNKPRQKELRIKTLNAVDEKYKRILKEKKIFNKVDILNKYFHRRFEVINFLIRNTPNNYRRNDALFQKGRIYWERGEQLGDRASYMRALKIWNSIPLVDKSDSFLYRDTLIVLKPIISKIKITDANFFQAKSIISNRIRLKERKDINKKIIREKKLLYP